MNKPFQVQILAEDKQLRHQWSDALGPPTFQTLKNDRQILPEAELVLTDQPLPDFASTAESPQVLLAPKVVWNQDRELVSHLPVKASREAFQLLCQFAATNTRLRRELYQQRLEQQELRQTAQRDPVTNLPNRTAWERQFPHLIQTAQQQRLPLCVAICDVDGFKRVNDEFGHLCGDRVLAQLGRQLSENLRTSDFLARLGGDEFGMVLMNLPSLSTETVMERIHQGGAVSLPEIQEPITVSLGYCCAEGEILTPSEFYSVADQALLAAKRAGKNQVRMAKAK